MRARVRPLAAALAALLCALGAVSARNRHHDADAVAGQFDYYLLSLSWSPAFCLQSPGAAECNGPRRYGFIVHGLWPQNERGWPEFCGADRIPAAVADGVADIMPARSLVFHEWQAHGSCSGLDPAGFFALVRRAYQSVGVPASVGAAGGPIEQSPAAITAAFLAANPQLPSGSVVATCGGGAAPRLREVHVCFTRDLAPRVCSADALREACRAATVIVPPIR